MGKVRYFAQPFALFSKYLSDPIEDVRVSTENLLAEFLQEVRDIAVAQKRREDKLRKEKEAAAKKEGEPDVNESALFTPDHGGAFIRGEDDEDEDMQGSDVGDDSYDRDTGGEWLEGEMGIHFEAAFCMSSLDPRSRCQCKPPRHRGDPHPTVGATA